MQELIPNRLYVFVEDSFGANQYLLTYPRAWVTIEASVPWSEVDQEQLCSWLQPGKIILTHGHLDHLGRVDEWKKRTQAPVLAHSAEVIYFRNALFNGTGMYGEGQVYETPDILLEDGQQIPLAEDEYLETWHLPGHTRGSCVFLWYKLENTKNQAQNRLPLGLFTGDVLIETSIGRTDFPGGNPQDMQSSLLKVQRQLKELPASLPVYCGHGSVLTVGEILQYNPWLRAL